jgi:hypothetical protein
LKLETYKKTPESDPVKEWLPIRPPTDVLSGVTSGLTKPPGRNSKKLSDAMRRPA